ncbi:mitochondrial carrier protein [Chloropicon primus]|uniref:Mitochondrial carrier protein n=1 Tax=Chloropicon primus TaxID=1764295 RepID=A0A5B8MIC1_9CHLO|nr:mitochondrial carrier protein [Chloropicon primus]UPQ99024.1 mitochondrial carrier protein [Chloropicon primus]|eukprot:QDZ19814.1 mitochondrial carrier protein [Chloropicon primus]
MGGGREREAVAARAELNMLLVLSATREEGKGRTRSRQVVRRVWRKMEGCKSRGLGLRRRPALEGQGVLGGLFGQAQGSKGSLAFAAFSPEEPVLGLATTLRGGGAKKEKKKLTAVEAEALQFRKKVHTVISNLLAGAIAGASVESALYPIDTIKTRLQAMKGSVGLKDKVGALRGSTSLYSGLLGNLVGVIPASALFFSVYEPVKNKLMEPSAGIPQWCAQFTAAATAAVSASFIRVPTEVIKSRMQVGQFKSAITAMKTIVRQEGFTGVYAGYKSFLLRDITFDVIEFVSYEQIRNFYLQSKGPDAKLNALEGSGIGAVAGALTATFTTPFDVIKTRMMLQGTNKVYAGVFDCTRKMIAEEGMGALFKGVGPRVTWISIGGAVFFGALEKAKSLLEGLGPKEEE